MAELPCPTDPVSGIRVGRILFFGATGAGKTELMARMAVEMCPDPTKIHVISPVDTLANCLARITGQSVVWYKIEPGDTKQIEGYFRSIKEQKLLLCLDEGDSYLAGDRFYGSKAFHSAVNFGRNYGQSLLIAAHGTNEAPKNLIANSSAVVFFRTTEFNLRQYAKKYMDDIPDAEELLQNLPPYIGLLYVPPADPKFQGFIHLNIDTNEIEILPPEAFEDDTWNQNTSDQQTTTKPETLTPEDTAQPAAKASPTAGSEADAVPTSKKPT